MEINAHWPHKCGTFMNKGKKNKQSSRPSLVPLVRVIWYWRNWGEHNSFFTIYTEMRLRSFLRIPLSGCFLVVLLNFSRLKKKKWQMLARLLSSHEDSGLCEISPPHIPLLPGVCCNACPWHCSDLWYKPGLQSTQAPVLYILLHLRLDHSFGQNDHLCYILLQDFLLFLLISYVQIWLRLD